MEQIGLQETSSKHVKSVYNTQCVWMSSEEAWTPVKAPEVELVASIKTMGWRGRQTAGREEEKEREKKISSRRKRSYSGKVVTGIVVLRRAVTSVPRTNNNLTN